MRLKGAVLFTFIVLLANTLFAQIGIGTWREHLPYHQAIDVVQGAGKIYCATPYSIFTVDLADNSIDRLSKMNGLSEVGISAIQLDEQTNKLIIAYVNSNIDILFKNDVIMVDALKRKEIPGNKNIYDIFCYQEKAYLSTGLGIVVIDESKYEVKDTYVIGDTGNNVKVNGIATDGNLFYAATEEGLKKAPVNGSNLADYRSWQMASGTQGLPKGSYDQVVNVQNKIIVRKSDSLFILNGTVWNFLYASDWMIKDVNSSSGKLVVCQQRGNAESRIMILNVDGTVNNIIAQSAMISDPAQAILASNETWIADRSRGLIRSSGNSFQQYQPNSPLSIATGEMIAFDKSLWVTAGSVTSSWTNTFNKNGIYHFTNNEWINYNLSTIPSLDTLYDLVTIARGTTPNTVWSGSFGGGLVELNANRSVKVFKQNSPLEPSRFDPKSYLVAGLAVDLQNNLWVSNYGASQNISVMKPDGTWRKFSAPFSYSENAVSQIVIDDQNQKWIVSPKANGLLCFNHGLSVDNTADDRWKYFRAGKGNGNLPDNNVLSVAKDKNGFIWVGTMKGVGIIQCPQQVFDVQGCEAVLPVVQQDNFAGYLFRDEEVQTIAIDGADRKWIGTRNGAWLISPEGEKTIYRFKEEDSPLLSNDVKKITVDPQSGEVFFATANGICSFMGTATEGGSTNENVLIFPNPVPPGYTGSIAIRGLVNNAVIKITELDGRLVYQDRALGGQATWNGRDYKGRQISTGVYLVIVSDDTRQEKTVGKIVVVGK